MDIDKFMSALPSERDAMLRAERRGAKQAAPAPAPTKNVLNVIRVALDRADMSHRATGFKPFEIEAAKAWVASNIAARLPGDDDTKESGR
jgi:hypothetical protein